MRIGRRQLVLALACLAPATVRAAPCDILRDLTDLYIEMDHGYAASGRLPQQDARHILLEASRLHPGTVTAALDTTDIARRAATALRPLEEMRSAGMTRIGGDIAIEGLGRATTGQAIARALTLLGQLDCPQPEVEGGGREPRLWDAAVRDATAREILMYYGSGGAAFAVMGLLICGVFLRAERRKRLQQRFVCSIPATVSAGHGGACQAQAADLSREGVKLVVKGGTAPEVGECFTLRIGPQEALATVRWGNAHVFGSKLQRRLSKAQLDALLALSVTHRRRQARNPADRGARTGAAASRGSGSVANPGARTTDGTQRGAA